MSNPFRAVVNVARDVLANRSQKTIELIHDELRERDETIEQLEIKTDALVTRLSRINEIAVKEI